MLTIKKSATFRKRLVMFTRGYRERAGVAVALNFVEAVDNATKFIHENPELCGIDIGTQEHDILRQYNIRKWNLKKFPHSIFFRIEGELLILETIYAHRMEQQQFYSDITDNS